MTAAGRLAVALVAKVLAEAVAAFAARVNDL